MREFLDGEAEILKHGQQLPHWQQGEVMQFVTFRLGDAMPVSKLNDWREQRDIWCRCHPEPWDENTRTEYHRRFTARLEMWLDQGSGSCLFKKMAHREELEKVFFYDQGVRVDHHIWVIMPNHVHMVFTPMFPLPKLIAGWKSISARRIGQGSIWQRNYRDTLIRDSSHFTNAVRYIRNNPKSLQQDTFSLWQSDRALAIS